VLDRGERRGEIGVDGWESGGREVERVAGRLGKRRVAGQEADYPSPTKCSDAHNRLATSLLAAKPSLTKSAS